jgi:inhibitor of the pro-sigma K processing machinery
VPPLELSYEIVLAYLVGIIFLFFIGRLFLVPLKIILKLIYNCLLGAILLMAVNFIGRTIGFSIPLNIFSAALVGFLGIPGMLLLVALKLLYF